MSIRLVDAPPTEPAARVVLVDAARDVGYAWAGDRRGAKLAVFFFWAVLRSRVADKWL